MPSVRPPGTGPGLHATGGPTGPGGRGGESSCSAGVAEERLDAEGTGDEGGGNAELIRQREAEVGKAQADAERSEVVKAAEE